MRKGLGSWSWCWTLPALVGHPALLEGGPGVTPSQHRTSGSVISGAVTSGAVTGLSTHGCPTLPKPFLAPQPKPTLGCPVSPPEPPSSLGASLSLVPALTDPHPLLPPCTFILQPGLVSAARPCPSTATALLLGCRDTPGWSPWKGHSQGTLLSLWTPPP